ncbi:hypothetical protein GCM10029976_044810 [Kribbella albertanoniae]
MVDVVDFEALGVAVWLGAVVGFRVPSRLGTVLDLAGVGVGVGDLVTALVGGTVAVRRGVADGLIGRIGVGVAEASSVDVGIAVSGCSWPVAF